MYCENVKLERVDGEYIIKVKGESIDKLFQKHNGNINITIKAPQTSKTSQQMRAIRALWSAFFYSGCHSAPEDIDSLGVFTLWMKKECGVCYRYMVNGVMTYVPESMANYTKDEMTDTIEKTLKLLDITQAIHDPKIMEILEGMKSNELY